MTTSFDTSPDDGPPGRSHLPRRVRNGDIRADQPDPASAGPGGAQPAFEDGPPVGRPLTDAEVDALPVEETGP
jgi:hypothetical protein